MQPGVTQAEPVTNKKNHEGFQSTLGMAIYLAELSKWVSNDMDIGDKDV
jgi:hypothetical protein